jgi:hypothetical protein
MLVYHLPIPLCSLFETCQTYQYGQMFKGIIREMAKIKAMTALATLQFVVRWALSHTVSFREDTQFS